MTFDSVLADIIQSTLSDKMGKTDPEYKNFKENIDHVNTYFIDRYNFISDELIYDVFTAILQREQEIIPVINKNMMDFCDLCQFFIDVLNKTNSQVTATGSMDGDEVEEENIFKKIVDCFTHMGNEILNLDP